ncbi:MAG: DUF748 domain-containing protein [Comamonadaceae bacterium]|nr:MAG: DUF748 domain-containing protein [Comamonadaceae bacterium]
MPNPDHSPQSTPSPAPVSRKASVATALRTRWLKCLVWLLACIAVLWALGYAVMPVVLKSQLEKTGSEKLGRAVTIGAVNFKPWSLELTIDDLAIAGLAQSSSGASSRQLPQQSPQKKPLLKIAHIYIDAELVSLLRLVPVADAVVVDDAAFSVTHLGGGRYDIDDLIERFKPAPDQPPSDPAKFALYNLALNRASVDFEDRSVGRTHELRDLNLSIPFLSNLDSKRDVKTEPHLAFKLNGSAFDTAAAGTPFASTRKTDATITLKDLNLAPYLGYWPASLPFRLESAVLNADTRLAFEQTPSTVVRLSGAVTVSQVVLRATGTAPGEAAKPSPGAQKAAAARDPRRELLAFDRLRIVMEDVRPLDQFVRLSQVELTAPVIQASRDRAGRLNWLFPADARKTATVPVTPASAPAKPAAAPWKVQVAATTVRGGTLHWLDETLASPAQVTLNGLTLDATDVFVPFTPEAPLHVSGSLGLDSPVAQAAVLPAAKANAKAKSGTESPAASAARLAFTGTATDRAAQVTATLADWPLNMASKYVGQFLLPALNGRLDAQLGIDWKAGQGDQPQVLRLTAPQLAVSDVLLAEGRSSLVSVRRVELSQVDIDVAGQAFKAAKMQLVQPKARVDRGADRRWMYQRWMVERAPGTPPPPPPTASPAGQQQKSAAPDWTVNIDQAALEGGAVSFSDQAGSKPVAFEVSAMTAQLGALSLDDHSAKPAKPMPLTASLRIASSRFEPGKVDFKGNIGLFPVMAQGRLVVERLPVQAFEPYFADNLNVELLRADASFKGRVNVRQTPAGPLAQVSGDAALEEFRANTLAPSEDLLAWKALNLRGIEVALDPAKATRVDVKETVLTDFFARVIVMPDGRINLQDLLKAPGATATSTTTAGVTATLPTPTPTPTPTPAAAIQRSNPSGGKTTVAAASAAAPAVASGPAPVINFGPMSLVNGKVLFSDRFVKPNYSADLTELSGKLGAFSSVPAGTTATGSSGTATSAFEMADLELRGRAESTASLEIFGKLNPLAKPLALDVTGKVRDLELPPLSPYSIKYSGYGINRGKLSVDVNYVVLPDGRLTASNKLVLNQLSFGDKVEGSTASLPVKLAVALLADRNGVIDLDLPISGSLNDPQFSLGPIIIKVIFNVITKAITAPFSLLASALGGGGEELSMVGFAPGSAALAPEARGGLDRVAKALTDRPALRLTVTGTSSVEAERDGFKRERLAELVRAEKRRETVKGGGTTSASITVSPNEYPALLKEVYKRADLAKPRNLVGMAKDLPVQDMENLLLADIRVSDDAMRELALRRGVAVKDYLATKGLPPERLFLGAAKTVPPESRWTPRAELNLAAP